MRVMKIVAVVLMIFSIMGLNLPETVSAARRMLFAEAGKGGITENLPEMLSPDEIEIPREKADRKTKVKEASSSGFKGWHLAILGALVAGIAAGGGGGGGGGEPRPEPIPPVEIEEGSITYGW